MSRMFSTASRQMLKWLGYDRSKLSQNFRDALQEASKPGGKMEQTVGTIQQITIKSRGNNPVHQSHFNPADKAWIISARVIGSKIAKTFHIYEDGGATSSKDDPK